METSPQNIARRFLATGRAATNDDTELTTACVQLILAASRRSYRRALALSERFAGLAQSHSSRMRLMAFRVLGQMNHMCGRHPEALEAFQQARRLAPGDPVAKAGMDRMLIDVYMYLGRYGDARRAATRSLKAFARAGLTSDWHKARVNYANLLHRLDRHHDAGRMYAESAEFFRQAGDPIAAARCDYNFANTLVQLFETDEADRGYDRARKIYEQEGFVLDACDVRYGQAWLRMLKGELHIAMLELGNCATTYHEAGDRRGEALCNLDLSEVSIGLGLFSDALDSARKAENQFARLNLRYERSKAALFRGQAALALGKKAEAAASGERAREGFRSEGNIAFSGVAQLLFVDVGDGTMSTASQHLQRAGRSFRQSQLPLWKAVCDLRLAQLPRQSRQALGRLAHNKAAQVVPHVYAGWQTIQGDRHHEAGEDRQARICWERAADRLDSVRSQLPPFELRTNYGRSFPSPHARLVAAEAGHDPRLAAIWSERLKTAGVWAPISSDLLASPKRRQIAEKLEALASQVAFLMRQMPGQQGARGISTTGAQRTLHRLRLQLRREFSEMESAAPTQKQSLSDLDKLIATTSQRLPIVQFHVAENDIYGFVHQHGRTTICTIRDGRRRIAYSLERWRFFMERHLFPAFPGGRDQNRSEDSLWAELGSWLWQPLNVDPSAKAVLIVAEGHLANIPWQAIPIDGKLLAERHHITLAPSIRHFVAAEAVRVTSPEVRVFHGDVGSLPHTQTEISILRDLVGDALTTYSPSRRADWPTEGESRLWHYAGHAVLRSENPFYSYLLQSDGPLFAADFRMRRCRVGLATLAACRTGEQVAVPGEEATGLVRSLLEMGARNVVAGRWPVSDESASYWMTKFYNRFLRKNDLFTAAREATLEVKEKYPSAFHWSAFAVFGAGLTGGQHEAN